MSSFDFNQTHAEFPLLTKRVFRVTLSKFFVKKKNKKLKRKKEHNERGVERRKN